MTGNTCRAFRSLAYKRYQHVPIYLEWAPANIFRADAPKPTQPMALPLRTSAPAPAAAGQDRAAAPAAASEAVDNTAAAAAAVLPEVEDSESSTIYIKNLAFATGVFLLMQQSSMKLNMCTTRMLTLG